MRSLLVAAALTGALLGLSACGSSRPAPGSSTPPGDSTRREQIMAQIERTPDSLATLPRPLFFRSDTPVSADPGLASHSRIEVEAVGGPTPRGAQWGLLIRAVVPDTALLRDQPFVDLYGRRLMMRRGHAWRTVHARGDSLVDARFVPLSARDLQRMAQAEPVRMDLNWGVYSFPAELRTDLRQLYAATPDSMGADTTGVRTRLTVLHTPDVPPDDKGGMNSLTNALEYPEEAKTGEEEGRVMVQFLVDRRGQPSHIEVQSLASPSLMRAAVRTVRKVTFTPGRHNGRPVPVWMDLPISFEIR